MKKNKVFSFLVICCITICGFASFGVHNPIFAEDYYDEEDYYYEDYEDEICEHDWDDWEVTKEATCTKQGEKERTCWDCGEVQTETIPAKTHDWEKKEYKRCNDKYHYLIEQCKNCDEQKKLKKEHRFDKGGIELVSGSKTKVKITYTCKDCGKTKSKKTKSSLYASKIRKLPQGKISFIESYPWYEDAKWSYTDEEIDPKYEYYNGDRDAHYIIRVDFGCRKEKGNVKYEFAFKHGSKGTWDKFSYGKSRGVYYCDIPRDKTVYVKVRTYKELNGKRYYGKWSSVVKESSHRKDITSVSPYAKDGYVKGYIIGAFKGEKIKVKIGKKTYSTTVKKTSKRYPFKIYTGQHTPGQTIHVILCSPIGSENLNYSYRLWYARKVKVGFTKKQVRWTWGSPESKTSSSGGWSHWYWSDGSSVDFKNGRVKYWYNAAG